MELKRNSTSTMFIGNNNNNNLHAEKEHTTNRRSLKIDAERNVFSKIYSSVRKKKSVSLDTNLDKLEEMFHQDKQDRDTNTNNNNTNNTTNNNKTPRARSSPFLKSESTANITSSHRASIDKNNEDSYRVLRRGEVFTNHHNLKLEESPYHLSVLPPMKRDNNLILVDTQNHYNRQKRALSTQERGSDSKERDKSQIVVVSSKLPSCLLPPLSMSRGRFLSPKSSVRKSPTPRRKTEPVAPIP